MQSICLAMVLLSSEKTPLQDFVYPFTGAVEGVVIQQVGVLPEELTVHLGSYGAGAGGNRP